MIVIDVRSSSLLLLEASCLSSHTVLKERLKQTSRYIVAQVSRNFGRLSESFLGYPFFG